MKNLIAVNKHCMTDGTREYYKNSRGEWRPGSYDGKNFIWARTRKYAARRRTYQVGDETMSVRLTRYTSREV